MKPFLRSFLGFALLCQLVPLAQLHAQFSQAITNPQIAGNNGHLKASAVLTVDSGASLVIAAGGNFTGYTVSLTSGVSGILPGANGGTGVANTGKTITLGGNVTLTGAYAANLTLTGSTAVTLPTAGTLATLAGSETLSNKTLTAPVIASIVNTGSLTLPTLTDTLVGRNTSDTFTNKTISGANNTLSVRLANDVTGILPAANGGTGNGFAAFTGPASATKTFTLPNANATILTDQTTITVAQGGTGQASFTKGDILVASGSTTLVKLGVGANNTVLTADSAQTSGVKWGAAGGGTVSGPGSTTSGSIVEWNATDGTVIKQATDLTVDASNFSIPAKGLIFGTASASAATGKLLLYGNDDASTIFGLRRAAADAFSGGMVGSKSRGSMGSPAATQSGDGLFTFWGGGYDGGAWAEFASRLNFSASEAWGGSAHGTKIILSNTPNGSTTRADQLTIGTGSAGITFNQYGAGALATDSGGNITATSDARLKNITGTFSRGLFATLRLHPKMYEWKREVAEGKHVSYPGFIAQDVQQSIPEAVGQGPDGMLTLQDRGLIATLVNAVKTLTWLVAASLVLGLFNLFRPRGNS